MGLANNIHDAFEQVRADSELKAETLRRLEKRRRPIPARPLLGACAVAALLLALGGGWWCVGTPVSYVSVDVNPSLELACNRLDRVISATAYNEDGETVLAGVALKGLRYTEALDVLLESEAMEPYLTPDSALTVTVAARSVEREEEVLSGVQSTAAYRSYGGQSYCAPVESIGTAHGCGMSFGKYAAARTLMEYDDAVTVEQCHHMTMAELQSRIRDCAQEHHGAAAGETASQGGSGHHGGHHGGGHG